MSTHGRRPAVSANWDPSQDRGLIGLARLADQDEIGAMLPAHDGEEALARFGCAGIDIDPLAVRLQGKARSHSFSPGASGWK